MPVLLSGLLNDLLQRCRRLKGEVEALELPVEIDDYQAVVVQLLDQTEQRIQALLQDPGIQVATLAKYYLHEYRRLAERIYSFESGPVLALTRYSDRDRLATLICQRIAQEIGYPYPSPLCVALSAHYYWTTPYDNLIWVPVMEPFHLLGLPDLYHEVGHIILIRNEATIIKPFLQVVDSYFDTELRRVNRERRPPAYREELERHRGLWKRHWGLEFASDMIAAYLAGPAYGWANVRLCTNQSVDPYASDPDVVYTHPADDARNEAIGIMLKRIEFEEAAANIQALWDQFVALIGQVRPQEYELRYPPSLLTQLLDIIHQQCQTLGLVAYGHLSSNPVDIHIATLLNEAWERFNESPEQFPQWEERQVEQLRQVLGL